MLTSFQKQYEAYLLRAYTTHRPPGSVTGDSGIASQNEDKYTKKTVAMAHPELASAETRSVSSPRVHSGAPDPRSSQPRSFAASKFRDQVAVDASLNNPPSILTAAPIGAALDVDHRQTSVLREPHVYAPMPNAHQYLRIPSNYDGSAPRKIQHVPDIRVSHMEAPVLASSDNMQFHAVPANRFFREHVELTQTASGSSAAARFPAEDTARYEENVPVPRQFEPSTLLHDANLLLSDPRLRRRGYDPSDTNTIGPALVTGKSSTYLEGLGSDVNVANQIGSLPGYMDYVLASSQRSDGSEGSTRSITSDDLDGLIRRNERLLWSKADIAKTPRSPIASRADNANLDENDMTAIVENELDRYISNIRKLHREHGVQSLDELDHEQNTSGDLLNVSLSEDALELSAEDRARKEQVPEEMGKILALASDLASRTANLKEVARDSTAQNGSGSLLTEGGDGIRHREIAKSDASEFKGKYEAEGRATSMSNEIREDVATHSAKLELPRGDIEITKENWNNADESTESRECDREVSTSKKNVKTVTNDELRVDDPRNGTKEKQLDLVIGKESNIEDLFDAADELAPWDLASMQKKVRELRLDDSDGDRTTGKDVEDTADKIKEEIASKSRDSSQFVEQSNANGEVENARPSQDTLPRSEMETKKLDAKSDELSEIEGQNKTHEPIEDVENKQNVNTQNSKILSQQSAGEIASQPSEELGEPDGSDRRKQDNNETTELQVDNQFESVVKDSEYSVEQEYVEDPSQTQQYEQQDPNQQYYDPNVPYEAGNEEYGRYADQGYAQEGQEYIEYVEGQYEQYPEDVNNQQYQHYPDTQYEQDPNQTYDYGYDPNQEYGDPGQQYDPNQGYENNPDNQAYGYSEQVPYDSTQTYDNAYEQEYKEEQPHPDVKDHAEEPEMEEASQKQADPESEHKSDGDGDKSADVVNEANGSKKKKDVIKSLLDSDTDTTIERNVSNTESDFDFN